MMRRGGGEGELVGGQRSAATVSRWLLLLCTMNVYVRTCEGSGAGGGAHCGDTRRSAVSEVSVADLSNIVHSCHGYLVCTMQWLSLYCPLLTLVRRAFR